MLHPQALPPRQRPFLERCILQQFPAVQLEGALIAREGAFLAAGAFVMPGGEGLIECFDVEPQIDPGMQAETALAMHDDRMFTHRSQVLPQPVEGDVQPVAYDIGGRVGPERAAQFVAGKRPGPVQQQEGQQHPPSVPPPLRYRPAPYDQLELPE